MSQKPQDLLNQADLQRRVKELDAREQYLSDRERIAKAAPNDIKVLEETLRVVNAQITKARVQFKTDEEFYAQRLAKLDAEVEDKESEINELSRESKAFNQLENDCEQRITVLETELNSLEADITERKKYLTEQEKTITETIDEGNATLRGINYEIHTANERKDDALAEVAEVEQKKTNVAFELMELEGRMQREKYDLEQQLEVVKSDIALTQRELSDVQQKVKSESKIIDDKLMKLNIEERSIVAKQSAIRKERADLDEDKRRWNSNKSQYGDTI